MKPQIVGLGAGGHALVLIETLQLLGRHRLVGLLDPDRSLWGSRISGVTVLGGDEELAGLAAAGVSEFFVGLGGVASNAPRCQVFERGLAHGLRPATIIHPQAWLAPSAVLGAGACVLARGLLNSRAQVGENALINCGAIVEHDCTIGRHVHVASGAVLAGGVAVGAGAHIGAGATVRQGIRIGTGAVVGAGAVVVQDVPPETVVVGVPARPLEKGGSSSVHQFGLSSEQKSPKVLANFS